MKIKPNYYHTVIVFWKVEITSGNSKIEKVAPVALAPANYY